MTYSDVPGFGTVGLVSFVIPVMNESESLQELHARITDVCQANSIDHQIVWVDDGSTDDSWQVMQRLVRDCEKTEAIRFRRNFGKASALSAGAAICHGQIVVTMDADLQDDPEEIPRFLAKMQEGFDVVSGWKEIRHDPWHKTIPSRLFNSLVTRMSGVKLNDHNCGFKSYRREIFDELDLYGERHRFIPVLAAARGWSVGQIAVKHHPRRYGHSKYGVSRLIKGFLDLTTIYLLTGFTNRPQHLIGSIGIFFFSVGGVGLSVLSGLWIVSRSVSGMEVVHLHETAIFYYCILALLFGAQFVLAGLLSELIVSRTPEARAAYSISQHIRHESNHLAESRDRETNA